jgi:hypothetical protein
MRESVMPYGGGDYEIRIKGRLSDSLLSLPGRRAGLEFVERLLTTNLTSTDTTERNASMLRPRPARRITGRAGYCSWWSAAEMVMLEQPGWHRA